MNAFSASSFGEMLRDVQDKIRAKKDFLLISTPTRKALFRSDGLIVSMSDAAHDFLDSFRGSDLPFDDGSLAGEAQRDGLVSGLHELVEQGVFSVPAHEDLDSASACISKNATAQPQGISLLVSQTCNLRCRYCYAGGGSYGSATGHMDLETAIQGVDSLLRRSPERDSLVVTFFGGEPLLNFDLIQAVVNYCKGIEDRQGKKFRYSITTNGTILRDEVLELLQREKFSIMVSLDPGKDIQNAYRPFRGGHGSYDTVTSNIRKLVAAGIPVQLRATIVREMATKEGIDQVVKEARKLGARHLFMSVVDTVAVPEADFGLSVEDKNVLKSIYIDITHENFQLAQEEDSGDIVFDPNVRIMKALAGGQVKGIGRCGACFSMAAVSTEGEIYPCHRFVGMKDYRIGDVQAGVDSERIERFFKKADEAYYEKCSKCWARRICGGMCYHHVAAGDGGFDEPDEKDCVRIRQMVLNATTSLLNLRDMPEPEIKRYLKAVRRIC